MKIDTNFAKAKKDVTVVVGAGGIGQAIATPGTGRPVMSGRDCPRRFKYQYRFIKPPEGEFL